MCFIPIVRPLLTHWSWLQFVPFISSGSQRVWPVDRGCLLLLGTWSHLWCFQGSVEAWYLLCIVPFTWFGHWFWLWIFPFTRRDALILTADCFACLIGIHWFWQLIFAFEMGLTVWVWPVDRGCVSGKPEVHVCLILRIVFPSLDLWKLTISLFMLFHLVR
jgi:hypothetical protein